MSTRIERIAMAAAIGKSVIDHVDRESADYLLFGSAAGSLMDSDWWREVDDTKGAHRGEVTYASTSENAWGNCDEVSGEIG